jgi:hypothetical protein
MACKPSFDRGSDGASSTDLLVLNLLLLALGGHRDEHSHKGNPPLGLRQRAYLVRTVISPHLRMSNTM